MCRTLVQEMDLVQVRDHDVKGPGQRYQTSQFNLQANHQKSLTQDSAQAIEEHEKEILLPAWHVQSVSRDLAQADCCQATGTHTEQAERCDHRCQRCFL